MMMDRMLGMLESHHSGMVMDTMGSMNAYIANKAINKLVQERGLRFNEDKTKIIDRHGRTVVERRLNSASGGSGNSNAASGGSTQAAGGAVGSGEGGSGLPDSGTETETAVRGSSVDNNWDNYGEPMSSWSFASTGEDFTELRGFCDITCWGSAGALERRAAILMGWSPSQVYRGLEIADYAMMIGNPTRWVTRGAVKTSVIGPIQIGVAKSGPIWTKNARKGWSSVDNAFQHWKKHGTEFPEFKNAKQYAEGAKDFLHSPPTGTLSKVRSNGDVVRYNQSTNTFGIMDANGVPRTMYRPDAAKHGYPSNLDYFNAQ